MMRFPLRLAADVTIARIARKLGLSPDKRAVTFVDATEILHSDSSHPVSHEKIREVISGRSPVIWIGGSEPLSHPGIAHLVRAIASGGHFVFLETDGTALRRRIHEFQPTERLFLCVRLEVAARTRVVREYHADALQLAMEGIRAARLSGFSLCVRAFADGDAKTREIAEMIELGRSLDVDGIVAAGAARKQIGNFWWESLSRMIESEILGAAGKVGAGMQAGAAGDMEAESNEDEEGVRVV
jgi:hypothetical protein